MSENRMNNITMAVNLNLSQALDMTYIYGRVSAMCMMFDLRCPVILTNQRLPIGINSIWIRSKNDLFRMIVVSDRLDEEKTMKLIMSEIANKTHKYVQVVDERFGLYTDVSDMTIYYETISELAKSLQVKCPVLTITRHVPNNVSSTLKNSGGIAWNDISGKNTFTISLYEENIAGRTEGEKLLYVMEILAHEMRHVYQHEHDSVKLFENYRTDLPFEQYYLQPAELDAAAYAYCVLRDVCGLMLFRIRKFSPEVKKAIREKGKQMHPTYSFGLKNIGAILSETPRENLIAV